MENKINKLQLFSFLFLIFFSLIILIFSYIYRNKKISLRSKATYEVDGKYSMKERFGVGFAPNVFENQKGVGIRSIKEVYDGFMKIGVGWYHNWTYVQNLEQPIPNMRFLAQKGGYGEKAPSSPTDTICLNLKREIEQNRVFYPSGMEWTIGNEIGLDDGRKTAQQYAQDFVRWYDCLKSIDGSFLVGSGAISQPLKSTPDIPGTHCVGDKNDPRSGLSYFRNYINEIKAINSSKLPDFYVNHAYTYCADSSWENISVENFRQIIRDYRQVMKDAGEERKDLIIKEWGPFYVSLPFEKRQRFLKETVDFLATAKDPLLGNPDDKYRLVQKWAWYVLSSPIALDNDLPNFFTGNEKNTALINAINSELTPLGDLYRQLIIKYTNYSNEPADPRYGMSGWGGELNSTGLKNLHTWGIGVFYPTPSPGLPTPTPRITQINLTRQGFDINFNVGKIDNVSYTKLNYNNLTDPTQSLRVDWKDPTIWNGKPKCVNKNNPTDVDFCSNKIGNENYIPNDESYLMIDTVFDNYPQEAKNKVWEIANEPDLQPYIIPEDYAVWFHLFSKKIRQRDPTAKIMIGGLISSVIPNVYLYLRTDVICHNGIDDTFCHSTERFNWITRFREAYKQYYGDYPKIDIWSIHPYNPRIVLNESDGSLNFQSMVNDVKQYINEFRDFIEQLPETKNISEKNKPLYFTEYGSLSWEGDIKRNLQHCGLSITDQTDEWREMVKFINPLHDWLNTDSLAIAQKWYWFTFEQNYTYTPSGRNYIGTMGRLNSFDKIQNNQRVKCYPEYDNSYSSFNPMAIAYLKKAGVTKILNPSFEAPNYQDYGWNFWTSGQPSSVSPSIDSTEKHNGTHSFKVFFNDSSKPQTSISYHIVSPYFAGRQVNFSFFTKTTGGAKAYLKIVTTDNTGVRETYRYYSTPQEYPNWTKVEKNFFMPSNVIKLEFEGMGIGGDSGSSVWFDDFSFDIVENPGYIAGTTPTPTPTPTRTPTRTPTPTPRNYCSDSDGGLNYGVPGSVSGFSGGVYYKYDDICNNKNSLTEYYCSSNGNKWNYQIIRCPVNSYCLKNACVLLSPTPTSTRTPTPTKSPSPKSKIKIIFPTRIQE